MSNCLGEITEKLELFLVISTRPWTNSAEPNQSRHLERISRNQKNNDKKIVKYQVQPFCLRVKIYSCFHRFLTVLIISKVDEHCQRVCCLVTPTICIAAPLLEIRLYK